MVKKDQKKSKTCSGANARADSGTGSETGSIARDCGKPSKITTFESFEEYKKKVFEAKNSERDTIVR